MVSLKQLKNPSENSINSFEAGHTERKMNVDPRPVPRVLIFIGSLTSGGKERRLIEMLTYLTKNGLYEFLLVMTKEDIHYPDFHKLNIRYIILNRKTRSGPTGYVFQFFKICRDYRPQFIHSWGRIQTLYALPSVFFQRIPLLNSQITAAPPVTRKWSWNHIIDRLNFLFSDLILSNSKAGIDSFNPPANKAKVIYNGINLNRFKNLCPEASVKSKYGISTPFVVMMAASFTINKDYDLFYEVAEKVTNKRKDITFIGVGGNRTDDSKYREMVLRSRHNNLILFPGQIKDVESLVNASNIGMLFSNKEVHGEGISNAVLEYMCLGKPVIANDAGGTREIVFNNQNGYLVTKETVEEIASLVIQLIDDPVKCKDFGEKSKLIIQENFLLEKMGRAFEEVYTRLLGV